jgi:hypothetical protein
MIDIFVSIVDESIERLDVLLLSNPIIFGVEVQLDRF